VQPGKIRTAASIACDNLAVEHSRFGWELVRQLGDGWETLGDVVPVTAVDDIASLPCGPARGSRRTSPHAASGRRRGCALARIGLQGWMKRNAVTPQDVAVSRRPDGLLVVGQFEILSHRRAIHNRSKHATTVTVMMETVGAA